jgi:hypothetical protein
MRFTLLLFALIVCAPTSVHAKGSDLYPYAHTANPKYEFLARQALERMPERFDFMTFRSVYTNTRQYDPIAEETIAKMNALAFEMVNEKDPEKRERATLGYQFLIADHLANVGVVMQALSYARQNPQYGNPKFFEWVKNGLMNAVMMSRDGRTLNEAYGIVTFPEETLLLINLGGKLIRSQSQQEGFVYYTMNEIEEFQTGKRWTVFVNSTFPMRFLEKKEKFEKKEKRIELPRK